mmetsp:Transcript_8729/g.14529  ORF Transcript_8729/g.14529 Transcript_8729/m.14529 type:complete len:167 (+) Transcript_8729:59-559(+)
MTDRFEASAPALEAVNGSQISSIAELPRTKKYALFETLSEDNYAPYHNLSCVPITKKAEDDMELLSDIITWGEQFLHHWESGTYFCSRCSTPLYSSEDKYKGPCVWPSFRRPIEPDSIATRTVSPYNNYKVTVKEVYCGNCELFVGHQFEDAREKGDIHPQAHWRH